MAIWYKVQKDWPVPAVKATLWEKFCAQAKLNMCEKWNKTLTNKSQYSSNKLIWAVQFCKLGFAEVPLKFQDFRGAENLTLSPDECHGLSCSSPEALSSF